MISKKNLKAIIPGIILILFILSFNYYPVISNFFQPTKTSYSEVISKRTRTSTGEFKFDYYYVLIKIENNKTVEYSVDKKEYDRLYNGDKGYFTYKGSSYKSFDIKITISKIEDMIDYLQKKYNKKYSFKRINDNIFVLSCDTSPNEEIFLKYSQSGELIDVTYHK